VRTVRFIARAIAVAALAVLGPWQAVAAGTPTPVDPDNLSWVPPAGHVPVSERLSLDWALGQDVRAQEAPGDPPATQGNLRQIGIQCSSEPQKYKRQLNVRACWFLYKLDGEEDQASNYFWEEFLIGATGKNATHLSRVKGRNASPDGENVRWTPEGDDDYGSPKTETYTLGFSAPGPQGGGVNGSISRSVPIFPGRIHPYPDDRLFHSSWITNEDDGAPADKTINAAGMNVWMVPESAGGIRTAISWDVWCDCV
jgi:hypothetical protein